MGAFLIDDGALMKICNVQHVHVAFSDHPTSSAQEEEGTMTTSGNILFRFSHSSIFAFSIICSLDAKIHAAGRSTKLFSIP